MRSLTPFVVGFLAGAFSLAIMSSPRGSNVERTWHDAAKTKIHSVFTVDADGLPHGEMRVYHPSGRLKETLFFSHGQTARAGISHDPRTDAEVDAAEAADE